MELPGRPGGTSFASGASSSESESESSSTFEGFAILTLVMLRLNAVFNRVLSSVEMEGVFPILGGVVTDAGVCEPIQ